MEEFGALHGLDALYDVVARSLRKDKQHMGRDDQANMTLALKCVRAMAETADVGLAYVDMPMWFDISLFKKSVDSRFRFVISSDIFFLPFRSGRLSATRARSRPLSARWSSRTPTR